MGHINQPGPTGQITRFLGLPLAYPLAYGGDHRPCPPPSPPRGSECRKYYRGILYDRFSARVPFPRDNGNGLKTKTTTTTRTPPYWYACSSPRQNILSSVPDQFCNYLFRLRSRIPPLQPSQIPTRAYPTKGTSRVASTFRRFRGV